MLKTFGTILLTIGFTTSLQAIPLLSKTFHPPSELKNAKAGTYNFNGLVALNNCSGSIVRFDDSQSSDKALILTNGHCVDLLDPGIVIQDQFSNRSFTVLNDDSSSLGTIRAERLVYATMTKTDMAIYRLRNTYEEIEIQYNVRPLTFARGYVDLGTNIEVISGYWKRGYSCTAEDIIFSLKEGNWLFYDSIRYSRPGCDVIGGTSGSPVIDVETRMVIGVNNTINENGRECAVNNPCEVDIDGNIFYEKGIGYAQQTSWLYDCRDETGALNLNIQGCLLPQ